MSLTLQRRRRRNSINIPLAYDTQQMAVFIRETCSPALDPLIPAGYELHFHAWLNHVLARVRPELGSVLLGMAFYEAMFSSRTMCHHRFACVNALLAVALIVAEKIVRDDPCDNGGWAEATGFDVGVLGTLEGAWCGEVGWRVQPLAWSFELDGWMRTWARWCEDWRGL